MISIAGIGNPLMDLIMQSDFPRLEQLKAVPGTMNLVDRASVDALTELHDQVQIVPGGSCANTLKGFTWLAGKKTILKPAVYIGAVGNDVYGKKFEEILAENRITPRLSFKDTPTGVSGILVTPDHERTMFTYLGACRDLCLDDIPMDLVCGSEILYMAGYMWDTENQKAAVKEAVSRARACGITIAFDLADPFVVVRFGKELLEWIPGNVDILFANREELSMITGMTKESGAGPETVLAAAEGLADIIVMKVGSEGCLFSQGDTIQAVPGYVVKPLDTTGAGDSFAGGFLYGRLMGYDLIRSCIIANSLAAQVVTVEGCNYPALDRSCIEMI